MEHAVLGQAQRELAVGAHLRAVDERRFRTVHRLQAVRLVLGLDQEHVLAVQVPVTRLLPQLLVHQRRRIDLLVAAARLDLAHRVAQRVVQTPALWVPERGTRRDVVEAEQVELNAQLAVVALLGLLAPPQEMIELLLRWPGRAVDALHRWPLLVAAPVGARNGEQLERSDLARRLDVRTTTQVDERPLLVERRLRRRQPALLGVGHQVIHDLDLVRLALLGQERPGIRVRTSR